MWCCKLWLLLHLRREKILSLGYLRRPCLQGPRAKGPKTLWDLYACLYVVCRRRAGSCTSCLSAGVSGAEVRQGQGLGSGDKKRRHSSADPLSHGSGLRRSSHCVIRSGETSSRSSRRPTQQLPGQAPTPMQRRQWWWPMGRQRLI